MKRIRVLIVEDSLTVRERLREVLSEDSEIEVVGVAEDGKHGIELCQSLQPDVITLDMMLPVMSGLAATEYIMAHCPTPILIVSSSTNRGEIYKTYEALAAGAVEVLDKPTGHELDAGWEHRLISTVKLVSRIRVITHPRARLRELGTLAPARPVRNEIAAPSRAYDLIAVGTSTGGPAAILQLLRTIPLNFPIQIVIVIHIGEPFARAFADWLDGQTLHPVAYAVHGSPVATSEHKIVLAPPGKHLTIENGRFMLTEDAERHSCRPSVDVLFESIAREYGSRAVGCLLTGMGRDGAQGLLAMRKAGATTIAQDEASSVIYGMPREAALLGAAERVLPLTEIGPTIAALAQAERTSA
jgi:two-component system chemotaxis response regulator CheB